METNPSNPASPAGSPSGGGAAIDGAELARRMILATEAAATAATQAVKALEDLKSSNEKGDRSWYKLIQKPACFDPATRELEISLWKEWAWSFEQYLSNIDPVFTEDIKVLRSNPTNFVDSSVQHDDEKKRGALLYSLLASLVKQRPLMVVRSVLNNNGLEAYRQLLLSNEPVNKNRALSLLNVIMNWPQFSGKASFLSQILRLENAFYEYDKLGSKLAEELRTAVLLRSVTGQLKVWLQLQIDDTFGYDKVRELILSYERSTAKWTEQMVLGTSMTSDTSAPMEVDRIQKGKGSGKDQKGSGKKGDPYKGGHGSFKGKSKGDFKGKGKSQFHDKGKGKSKNSKSNDGKGYGNQWSDHSKGKGHGQYKGRGDGGKGGKSTIQCWHCGGNHKAANCWKNNHVRQVCDEQDATQQQQQQQSSSPPSQSSQSQRVSNSAAPSTTSATTYRVNRVSTYDDTQDLVFDLCGSDVNFSDMRICAVKISDLPSRCAEMFSMTCDSDSDDCMVHDASSSLEDIYHLYSDDTDWTTTYNIAGDITSCWFDGYDVVPSSYICLRDDRTWRPKRTSLSFQSSFATCFDDDLVIPHVACQPLRVCTMSLEDQDVEILIDSGSDATVVPLEFAGCGRSLNGSSSLVDCQGNRLHTSELREFAFVMHTSCGKTVRFREVGHVSSSVSCPIISYGKLFKRGWRIGGTNELPVLEHRTSNVAINMAFKNESFVLQGCIRRLQQVNAIRVQVPERWQNLAKGWYFTSTDFPMCRSAGECFIDPTEHFSIEEYPFRTTIALKQDGWEIVESCKRFIHVENKRSHLGAQGALTILSKEWFDPEDYGITRIASQPPSSAVAPEGRRRPVASASSRPQEPRAIDLLTPSQPDAVHSNVVPEVDMASNDNVPNDDQSQQQVAPDLPQQEVADDSSAGAVVLPPAGAQEVALLPDRSGITVNEVHLTPTSPIRSLRAACSYLGISTSGGKVKLFERILSFYDEQQLSVAQEVKASLGPSLVPREQRLIDPPTPAERRDHELTHQPYREWCPACIASRARPDAHKTDVHKVVDKSITSLSFDLSYTGKEFDPTGKPRLIDVEDTWKEKLIVLNAHDAHTGAVLAIPLQRKGDTKYMARELSRFAMSLGIGELQLYCDNEPTMLQVLSLTQRALMGLGLKVTTRTSKPQDHGSNALVEQTVHRVRQMAMTLIYQLETDLGYVLPILHPLCSWAFRHAAWILTRFVPRGGHTPHFLIHGEEFRGKCCKFGEMVMAYVANDFKQKGTAKWMPMIFVGISDNKQYIVLHGKTMRLTRSITRIFPYASQHLEAYQQVLVCSWMCEGVVGTRLKPGTAKHLRADTGQDLDLEDEAALDPEDILGFDLPDDTPLSMLAPSTLPSEEAPNQRRHSLEVSGGEVSGQSGPPENTATGVGATGDVAMGASMTDEQNVGEERSAKRQKLTVSKIGQFNFPHVDDVEVSNGIEFDFDVFPEDETFGTDYDLDFEHQEGGDVEHESSLDDKTMLSLLSEERLWWPITPEEPAMDAAMLAELDCIADQLEVTRLRQMDVLIEENSLADGTSLGGDLTARFVRTWRRKHRGKDKEEFWYRRSRLVAREFNKLCVRDDLYSPASNHIVERLVPALALSNVFFKSHVLGALDISDAYLQVPQEVPRRIAILDDDVHSGLVIRCLPGQRDGSRRWFEHFSSFLISRLDLTPCLEQPALFKVPEADGGGALLMHVDDVLFALDEKYLLQKFMPAIRETFKASMEYAPRTGGSFSFLKRLHVLEDGYSQLHIYAENKHIKQAYDLYSKHSKPPRVHATPAASHVFSSKDTSEPLDSSLIPVFRSILGAMLYISHERCDVQFTTKCLASYLKAPTKNSWQYLGRLLGYLKGTVDYGVCMISTNPGVSLFEKLNGSVETTNDNCLIESFTDADWQGGGNAKSTSAGCHFVNGLLVHTSSRTQHVISLSSTESEFYASTSGAIDTIYLKHIVEFLSEKPAVATILTDNSASRQIACKLGTSRLRHINGRLLWIQSKVRDNVLKMVQVGTLWNVSDIGTKNLARDRHTMLLYMLGMVDSGNPVGESIYLAYKQQEFNKRSIRSIKSMFLQSDSTGTVFPRSSTQQSLVAKHVLRVAVAQTAIALSQAMDTSEPNTQAMEHVVGGESSTFASGYFTAFIFCFALFATMMIAIFAVCFMVPEPEPESSYDGSDSESSRRRRYMFVPLEEASDPELWQSLRHHDYSSDSEVDEQTSHDEPQVSQGGPHAVLDDRIPIRPNMVRCYSLLSASFTRLKQLLVRDPRQRGRGFAVLYQLQQVFQSFEENRPNSNNYGLLHQMMAAISNMEEVAQVQTSGNFEIDDMDVVLSGLDNDPEAQLGTPIATDDEHDVGSLFEGDIPAADQPMSPESIAGWMVRRLSRRIYSAVVSGSRSLKKYYVMREIMRGTVLVCQRSDRDRRRAMFMLHDIRDLSDHSSSNASQRDPMEDFIDELPGDEGMDISETYQGDFYDFQERVYGPLDETRGIPLRAATIPAYVIVNGQIIYTIEFNELPSEAIEYDRDGDWVFYTFLGHRYRVRRWLTLEEPNDRSASSDA